MAARREHGAVRRERMEDANRGEASDARPSVPGDVLFRSLIAHADDLISVVEPDGTIRWASPSHERSLGYRADDLPGTNAFDLVHPRDLARVQQRFGQCLATPGDTRAGGFRCRASDGSWRVLDVTGTNLVDDPTVRGVIVNAKDITERRRTERALRTGRRLLAEQLAELDLVYRTAPVGLCLLDADLRYVRINDDLAAMNGLPASEHLGRTVTEVLPELAPQIEPMCRRVIETGLPIPNLEAHGTTPADPHVDKDWWVSCHPLKNTQGRTIGVSIVQQEITERKRAERALQQARDLLAHRVRERTDALARANDAMREEIADRRRAEESLRHSEERYRELVESIHEVIYTVDQNGRIAYVSPAIAELLGYTPEETIGRMFVELVEPADVPSLIENFEGAPSGQPGPVEYRLRHRDGSVRWVRSFGRAFRQDDRVVAWHGVLSNVTDRRLAEDRARRQQAELEHVQRLTTAGEMTAQIAHEINQPLCAIVNFADGLTARFGDGKTAPEVMRDVTEQIAHEARRAAEVIRRLREFLRKGESTLEPCNVNRVVEDVFRLVEQEFRRHDIAVRMSLDPCVPELIADRVRIGQVVLNLLRNALEAMRDEGGAANALEVTSRATDGRVHVTFRDTGVGLPRGAEGRIFDTFFTTKTDGLGLGLAVSRSIIDSAGGTLWAERNPDRGSTVGFTLHLDPAPDHP